MRAGPDGDDACARGPTQRRLPGGASAAWTHRQWTPLAHALAVVGDRWTLFIVIALARGRTRLSALKGRLPGISAGVLDSHVQRLTQVGLVTRERYREVPPRVELALTEAGRELVPVAEALARWGMRRTWSLPTDEEEVDVSVLLGLLPALLQDGKPPDGVISMVVDQPAGAHSELMRVRDGRAESVGEGDAAADARLEGSVDAWVAAFGPERDFGSLRLTGDRELALQTLAALPSGAWPLT